MTFWMFNTDESELPGVGAYRKMLASSCIATWGPITGNHMIALPAAGDVVFFYQDLKGVIAKAVFTEEGPFRSNNIFGKENEEEYSRRVVDLMVLPDNAPIRPAEVTDSVGAYLPTVGKTPHRIHEQVVVDYLLTRFPTPSKYVDQFVNEQDGDQGPRVREAKGQVFVRDAEVRRVVLERAEGRCEWCKEPGFVTTKGLIYLETHHVVSLAEGGRDTKSNVVAICPNHHREAHHGIDRDAMRRELLRRTGYSQGVLLVKPK